MHLLDENKLKLLHTLMREKGVNNVNTSMFNDQQKKHIYESYGEKFLYYNGLAFMVNSVISYSLAKNWKMAEKKLREELDYAFNSHDYDYALLCSKLLNDKGMTEFIRQYTQTEKYEKLFNEMSKVVSEARK